MHGPHDLGGRDGIGAIDPEFLEPGIPDWRYPFEGRMHAVTAMAIKKGAFNLDEQRHGIELMKWSEYLDSTYYAHWLFSVEKLLNDKGFITHQEIDERMAELGAPSMTPHPAKPETLSPFAQEMIDILWKGTPHDVPADAPPAFEVGDAVVVRNLNEATHNRLPGYLKKTPGVIARQYGAFHDPAASAHQQIDRPHQMYMVRFTATDLWGPDAAEQFDLYADLFEDYLEPANG
ncbi:nitrile hydratase subunit beta [Mycolicibacterium sp. 050158]|jgi:nitrile hydratase subunit beta|uniref:nitrile hydratase subunit beta n=1 Tax=Mycolicibacterium sp. 050158 TaxID=3090602 RepID=UPI00299D498F|nr:nitrile hydratase subunit beta [Mycolicibacterium sp. 050158]MDX1892174.1 nitrile hydratase subunit beta [Mycolicibacterium sp. 050158]